jgi:ribosomal protein L21
MIVRYRAKSRYHKRNGHRQPFMSLKIDAIN